AERDDGQQHDVAERDRQPGAEVDGYVCSSGATQRKPTPRTVSIQAESPSLRRSQPTWTSRVFVEPNQFSSHTRDIRSSRRTTWPAWRASSSSRSNSFFERSRLAPRSVTRRD